eukprot:Gregarina_sp_Poly_1__5277@NODE_2796_length_1708_cov_203_328458_g1759_i0_p1_GENE_NODE_2796_length_1708_cov_203_328458_g1759_i0NODE_2796_length_1708_cov_203_328458_g1759_i0_p1_ORF_typecomplete_len444_score60_40Exostosin/PF03016_15/3_6e17_NODE_2796_length_1708_cov_203_328458_g1759_i01341465
MRKYLLTVLFADCLGGTLPEGEFDIKNSWIKSPTSFFDEFNRLEKRKYFYPKGVGYLNSEAVWYKVLNENNGFPQVRKLAELCKDSRNKSDYAVNALMDAHEWRTEDDDKAVFFYVPTFAGAVLAGECGKDAEVELASLMKALWKRSSFNAVHGHDLLMYASSEASHERHLERTRKIAQDRIPYDFKAMENGDLAIIDYMMAQMTTLESFYRPTLQFCQLFFPMILPGDVDFLQTGKSEFKPQDTITWEEYSKSRPINIAMMEVIKHNNAKFAVREAAYDSFKGQTENVVQMIALKESDLSVASCKWNQIFDDFKTTHICALDEAVDAIQESTMRQQLFSQARFALITRGDTPHPSSLYDAMKSGTLIINTIDKNLDMGLPFQCQVPWEDFTIRIPTKVFQNNPYRAVQDKLKLMSDVELTKKIKLQKYYRPDVLVDPGNTIS